MAEYQQISTTEEQGVTVVRFHSHKIIDDGQIQQMGNELLNLVNAEQRTTLLLDFSGVNFLSSAALGKLIKLDKTIKTAGGKLKLCCIRPEIYEVFSITKLDQQFDIKETQADALAAF